MRRPTQVNLLACFLGAGTQLTAMFGTLLIAITFAFANTEWRASIYSTMMVILALFGYLNGYATARYLKFHSTTDWAFSAMISSFALPLFISGAMSFELVFAWLGKSAIRYSFKHNVERIVGWYLLNGVMCLIGSYRGYIEKATPNPVPLSKVARPIPDQPWFLSLFILVPVVGLVQFISMYAEFTYLVDSIFKSHMYAMFGFLLLNFVLTVIVIALLACFQTFLQLSYQNHEWQWRSFVIGGSGGIYLAAYSLYYMCTQMKLGELASDATFLIYVYLFIGCYICAAGSIAVQSSYYFVVRLYNAQELRTD